MKKLNANKANIENIDMDSTSGILHLIALTRNCEKATIDPTCFSQEVVEVAQKTAFFSWEFITDSCGVYTVGSLLINGVDFPIDSDSVPCMRQTAERIASQQGCVAFLETTPHDMGKAYNAARLANRADKEWNIYN